jgi:hypothetical protein
MTTIQALLIKPGEKPEVIDYELGTSLTQIRDLLGDELDVGNGTNGIYFTREWAIHEDPLNEVATALWWKLHPRVRTPLHGPIVLTGPARDDNETDVAERTKKMAEILFLVGVPASTVSEAEVGTKRVRAHNQSLYEEFGKNRHDRSTS